MLKGTPFLAILLVLASAIFSPAFAQDTTRIATLEISVWPEYDQPGVLVQYQGQLATMDQSGAAHDISFLVPKGAGVGAACGIKSAGSHTSETWKESDASDGYTINPNLVVVLAVLAGAAGLIVYFAFIRRAQPPFAIIPLSESRGTGWISRGGFCTECGTAMEPEDRFCARCGTARKQVDK